MRGRKPRPLKVAPADYPVLRLIARRDDLPDYQVLRARVVLAAAAGRRTGEVAQEAGCDVSTVWRICRRYERGGLSGLLADGRCRRPGSPAPHPLFGATPPGEAG
jgi:hypothetical protein